MSFINERRWVVSSCQVSVEVEDENLLYSCKNEAIVDSERAIFTQSMPGGT